MQKSINKDAVKRGLELNEHFTRITNPQWQELFWKSAASKLKKFTSALKKIFCISLKTHSISSLSISTLIVFLIITDFKLKK
jgi:hypothetical protein